MLESSVGDRDEGVKGVGKIKQRIHDVLTLYPGASVGALHTAVRPYGDQWRVIFEQMITDKEIVRETVNFKGRVHYRHYTKSPTGVVTEFA